MSNPFKVGDVVRLNANGRSEHISAVHDAHVQVLAVNRDKICFDWSACLNKPLSFGLAVLPASEFEMVRRSEPSAYVIKFTYPTVDEAIAASEKLSQFLDIPVAVEPSYEAPVQGRG